MIKPIKRLTSIVLTVILLGACAPSMAIEPPPIPGLNWRVWLAQASDPASPDNTLETVASFDLDKDSLTPWIMEKLPAGIIPSRFTGDAGTMSETNKQMAALYVRAALALADSISFRMTGNNHTLRARSEFLVQDGQVAALEYFVQDDSVYCLTTLLPSLVLKIDSATLGELLQAAIGRLPLLDAAGQPGSLIQVSDEARGKLSALIKALFEQPGVSSVELGAFRRGGADYARKSTITLTQLAIPTLTADMADILCADETFTQSLYKLMSGLLNWIASRTSANLSLRAPITQSYEEFIAGITASAADLRAEIEKAGEPFTALEMTVYDNVFGDRDISITLFDEKDVISLEAECAFDDKTFTFYSRTQSKLIGFTGTLEHDHRDMTLTADFAFCDRPDGEHALSDVMQLATAQKKAFTLSLDASAHTDGGKETLDYSLYAAVDGMPVGVYGTLAATREPFDMTVKLNLDLSALALPKDAIGMTYTSRAADDLPDIQLQEQNVIEPFDPEGVNGSMISRVFIGAGLPSIFTNLMKYMPQEAAPLLVLMSTLGR